MSSLLLRKAPIKTTVFVLDQRQHFHKDYLILVRIPQPVWKYEINVIKECTWCLTQGVPQDEGVRGKFQSIQVLLNMIQINNFRRNEMNIPPTEIIRKYFDTNL